MEIEIKTDDAKEMADKGENGDSVMGHLTPGEIVLPLPLAQKLAPVLKKAFEMMDMDIEQYTVGHEKNSMNEESGCPEFAMPPPGSPVWNAWNAGSPDTIAKILKENPELRQDVMAISEREDKASQRELEAAQAELDRTLAEQDALQKQIASELEAGKENISKTRQQTESTQRELGERKLSRVRARVRSLSRPMLSKGVSL
jgi:hypothetical protein